eukprot:1195627-Prorocentrum_minimum.AAC.4
MAGSSPNIVFRVFELSETFPKYLRGESKSPVVERLNKGLMAASSPTGYFSEPHSTVCSRMCATPVLSVGVVRKAMLKQLFWSSQSACRYLRRWVIRSSHFTGPPVPTTARVHSTPQKQ